MSKASQIAALLSSDPQVPPFLVAKLVPKITAILEAPEESHAPAAERDPDPAAD